MLDFTFAATKVGKFIFDSMFAITTQKVLDFLFAILDRPFCALWIFSLLQGALKTKRPIARSETTHLVFVCWTFIFWCLFVLLQLCGWPRYLTKEYPWTSLLAWIVILIILSESAGQWRAHQKAKAKAARPKREVLQRTHGHPFRKDQKECSICGAEIEEHDKTYTHRACRYSFHRKCLIEWYKHDRNHRCPADNVRVTCPFPSTAWKHFR